MPGVVFLLAICSPAVFKAPRDFLENANGVSQLTFWLGEFGDDQLATRLAP